MTFRRSVFVGIDPGKNGALAAVDGNGKPLFCHPFGEDGSSYIEAARRLAAMQGDSRMLVAIEKVWAMPHEGVSSAFSFGENFGFICGVVRSFGFDPVFATPRQWQKHIGVTGDKGEHIAKAKELFPEADLRRTPRCKKDHDGIADALLLAEYLRSVQSV